MKPLLIPRASDLWLRLDPMAVADQAPRGQYLAAEIGQLAGVSGKKIGQWARRGYIRSSWDDIVPRVYSYQDAAEAMVVHELENRGIAPGAIGSAVDRLRQRFGTEWPLQDAELLVPRRHQGARGTTTALVIQDDDDLWDVGTAHLMLADMDLIQIKEDLSRGGWAARDIPDLQFIEVNPNRMSGRPTIRGRRVSAAAVANIASSDDGWETLRDGYSLKDEEIRDAVRWWEKVQVYQAAA